MMLPGFRPEIGDIPLARDGLHSDFPRGSVLRLVTCVVVYRRGDIEKGWLITDTERDVNAAVMTSTKNLNIRANLEPITGLKIDLTALRNDTRNTEIQFMYEGMPEIMGGKLYHDDNRAGKRIRRQWQCYE